MRLEGKKALITGASRGIGRAMAKVFAEQGADVAVTSRNIEALQDTVGDVEAAGRTCHPMEWDVTDYAAIDDRLAEVCDALGGLDILVNNAGVVRLPQVAPDQGEEAKWDFILDINLKALVLISRAAADMMKQRGGGSIINVVSDIAFRGAASDYGVSKWGVRGFTEGLAKQCAPTVRVNGVAPGPVATGMMGCEDGEPREAEQLPLGRFSLPEEVADVALFLASDDARAVFGQSIVINTANS